MDNIVMLNIGGEHVCTSLTTLRSQGTNFLTQLVENDLQGRMKAVRDKDGHIFIDRNGKVFKEVILEYLRNGVIDIPTGITQLQVDREMDFYQIHQQKAGVIQGPAFLDQVEQASQSFVKKWLDENEKFLIEELTASAQKMIESSAASPWKLSETLTLYFRYDGMKWKLNDSSSPFGIGLLNNLAEELSKRWNCHCVCVLDCYSKPPRVIFTVQRVKKGDILSVLESWESGRTFCCVARV